MSSLILFAGRRFGRFAVLLFVFPVAVIVYSWLSLLDSHPGWFLGAAVIVLPLATTAIALLLGALFASLERCSAQGVSRAEAPGLWSAWESVAGLGREATTVILIDDRFNASIALERSLFRLRRDRVILTVGLPLLAMVDQSAVARVLAHEHAHVLNEDVNGGLRLAELEKAFEFVFEYASPESTISGRLLYTALGWLSKPLEKERVRLSREAEILADRHAATSGEAVEAAQMVMLVAAAEMFMEERVHEPLKRELLGAMTPPKPPLTRLLEASGQLSDRALLNSYARKAWERPDDESSGHPSWAQRLHALGYPQPFEIEPIAATALSTLLTENWAKQRIREFDAAWTADVANAFER